MHDAFELAGALAHFIRGLGHKEERWLCSVIRRAELRKGEEGAIQDIFGTRDLFDSFTGVYDRAFNFPTPKETPVTSIKEFASRLGRAQLESARVVQPVETLEQEEGPSSGANTVEGGLGEATATEADFPPIEVLAREPSVAREAARVSPAPLPPSEAA